MQNDQQSIVLTDAYRKARRMLTALSAILLAWEYVGITIVSEAQIPGSGAKITVKNPEVAPTVILLFVVYFSVRLYIEWKLCPGRAWNLAVCRVDVTLAYSLATIGVGVYVLQQIPGFRVADYLTQAAMVGLVIGTLAGLRTYSYVISFVGRGRMSFKIKRMIVPLLSVLVGLAVIGVAYGLTVSKSNESTVQGFRAMGYGALLGLLIKNAYEEWRFRTLDDSLINRLRAHEADALVENKEVH